jgi:hypothetical protein
MGRDREGKNTLGRRTRGIEKEKGRDIAVKIEMERIGLGKKRRGEEKEKGGK